MNRKQRLVAVSALLLGSLGLRAQGGENYGSGLKVNINPEGSKYVRVILWNQIWARSVQNNPGTLVAGAPSSSTWDIGARRLRGLAYAQVSPRYLILAHVGINNQTVANGGAAGSSGIGGYGAGKKPGIFFHDVWNEYAVVPSVNPSTKANNPFSLSIGAGLHYWNGISRMSSASTLNFLTIDAPVINWPTVDVSDQFVRQYGVYAKGKLHKLNYSFAVNKPFTTNATPAYDADRGAVAVDNNGDPNAAFQGYVDYQFLDQESNLLPFRVGSYVGTKKVFNLGAGFYRNANGTKSVDENGTVSSHNITLLGLDAFADLPFGERGMAVTAYSVLYKYNFGPNYIRKVGIMNTASGVDPSWAAADLPLNGPGNNRFFVGTGDLWYTQAGLLLPKGLLKKVRVQPFAAYTYKMLDYLGAAGHYWDAGANFFIDGHHAKITPQFSTRPLYYAGANGTEVRGSRGEFLIQMQVYL